MPFFPKSAQTSINPFTGYDGKMVHGARMSMVLWEVGPLAEVPLHTHEHEQIGVCLEGTFVFRLGDEEREMGPGDMVVIPSHVPHGGYARVACTFLDVFSPARHEYG
ncbi:MAG: cupin domain-containing protein [Bacteroidetes Order II. Incertae sedis bacterium]|nr:cupin domain-containing protein [Bacteroidetes Order II. bacterium]